MGTLILVMALLEGLLGCGSKDRPAGPVNASGLSVITGDQQTMYLGMAAPLRLVVQATDKQGLPQSNVEVVFAVVEGEGTVSPGAARTDADGRVSTALVAGDLEGQIVVQASTRGGATPLSLSARARKYPRLPAAEALHLLASLADTTAAGIAVRAALASSGFTLVNAAGGVLTSDGTTLTLGPAMVDTLARMELAHTRQSIAGFYTAFRASGYSIQDGAGNPFSTELFVQALQNALATAREYSDEPASNIVLILLSAGGEPLSPGDVTPDTELSPVQSALLLLALADVANPDMGAGKPLGWGRDFFKGASVFSIGLLIAGGLITVAGTVAAATVVAPTVLVVGMAAAIGYGSFMMGSALTDGAKALLQVSHATTTMAAETPTVAVQERGSGAPPPAPVAVARTLDPVTLSTISAGTAPVEVVLNGEASTPSDLLTSYEWDIDSDGVVDYTGARRQVTFANDGNDDRVLRIILRVTDVAGRSASANVTFTVHPVPNSPPVPQITVGPAGVAPPVVGTQVTLDGSASVDRETPAERLLYQWDFDGDGAYDTDLATANRVIEHAYATAGTKTVRLLIQDERGKQAVAQATVTVYEAVVSLTGFEPDPAVSGQYWFYATTYERTDLAEVQFSIDGGAVRDMIRQSGGRWRIPVRVAELAEGDHRAAVTAIDADLNPAGTSWLPFERQGNSLVPAGTGGSSSGGSSTGTPVLEVSVTAINVAGGRQETLFELRNTGTGTLTWTVREDESWLGVSSPQGDTGGDGEFSGSGDVSLTVITGSIGLADGVYDAVIQVRSNGGDVEIPMRMTVGMSGGGQTAGETRTFDLLNGATMEFVWIEPGTFTMGSPDSDDLAVSWEKPQHEVTLTKGFYLGKYEITQGQWEAVMGTRPWSGQSYVQANPNNPAVYISWNDVQEFIRKLNDAAGEAIYWLPTEAEWEYACRAGTTTRWSFGDEESQLWDYAWYYDNAWAVGLEYARPVGTKLPNPWGLYDMHGNVWEWCQDWYGDYSSSSQADPTGPSSGSARVVRGGDFRAYARDTRSAYRGYSAPAYRNYGIGARLLRIK